MINSLHRLDLLKQFPRYDYSNPKSAWLLDYRRSNNITASQMASFHYFWASKMCGDTGHIGISLVMPGIPYCLCVSPRTGGGVHIISPLENLVNLFQPESVSLIIISSAVSMLPCSLFSFLPKSPTPEARQRRFCKAEEIVPILREWANLLVPEGVMIANLIDESFVREAGWNLFEKDPQIQHVFTPRRFEDYIIAPLLDVLEIEELNSMCNHFSFQSILKKKVGKNELE